MVHYIFIHQIRKGGPSPRRFPSKASFAPVSWATFLKTGFLDSASSLCCKGFLQVSCSGSTVPLDLTAKALQKDLLLFKARLKKTADLLAGS